MKVNQTTNLRVEDFPEQASWISRLFILLNSFITSVNQVLDNNIDFATNIKSITKDFDFSSLSYPVTFSWTFTQNSPVELRICNATKNSSAVTLIPAWTFNASTREISINYLSEVSSTGAIAATTSGPRYKFTVRATI